MKKLTSATLALTLTLAVPFARADDNEAKAKALYKTGVGHYAKGEYKAAIKDLKAADELVQSPALAFNIAQSYRLLGDCKEALSWYRAYLDRDPLAPNKDKVNEHIASMLKCLPKKEEAPLPPVAPTPAEPAPETKPERAVTPPIPTTAPTTTSPSPAVVTPRPAPPPVAVSEPPPPVAQEPTPAPQPQPQPRPQAEERPPNPEILGPPPAGGDQVDQGADPGRSKRMTGLIVGGAGVATVAIGVVFALQAKSNADDVAALSRTGGMWTSAYADKQSAGQRDQTIGAIGIGLGAAAIIGGGILYYLGATEHAERPPVSFDLHPGGGNVVMTWQY